MSSYSKTPIATFKYSRRLRHLKPGKTKSKSGQFKNIVNIGRSINIDKRRKAKRGDKPGYGHKVDYNGK